MRQRIEAKGWALTTRQRHDGEIRDAVHGFVRVEHDEWQLLNSPFLQRLRKIHQLAMTYLVYPGATHKRFEHSLGVMELAGRVYDTVTDRRRARTEILDRYVLDKPKDWGYWRKVLRMAALCHDLGHLPFSHAAEGTLLPEGINHENISAELILSKEMAPLWESMGDEGLDPLDIAKIAVGATRLPDWAGVSNLIDWEILLHDIITHDALGVDRIDYLLRDSLHTGVAYGRFDHLRLLDTIRILPRGSNSDSPALGLEEGGVHTAESLLLARYFMFMQVYYHRVRAAYDVHLRDFLSKGKELPLSDISWLNLRAFTDIQVLVDIQDASGDQSHPAHIVAKRIEERDHFRTVHSITPQEKKRASNALEQYHTLLEKEMGDANVRAWSQPRRDTVDTGFPVRSSQNRIESFREASVVLENLPTPEASFLLVPSEFIAEATKLVENHELEVS